MLAESFMRSSYQYPYFLHVYCLPFDRLRTCLSRFHRCRLQPSMSRIQIHLLLQYATPGFFPFALTWRLCRDHSWVLAGWCAAPNARVVWFHAGGADVLLHHLERLLAFSIYATSPGIDKASDDKRAWTLCSIASCTQSCS